MKKFLTLLVLALVAFAPAVQAQDSVLTPTPSVVDTSVEAKQARATNRILNSAKSSYAQLVRIQKEGIDAVWHNREGLTPQQVCDALGAKAGKVFAIHAALTDALIKAQTADGLEVNVAKPTNAFVVNPDGTVTITDQPYTG